MYEPPNVSTGKPLFQRYITFDVWYMQGLVVLVYVPIHRQSRTRLQDKKVFVAPNYISFPP